MALEFELGANDPRTVKFSDLADRTPITAGDDYTQPEMKFYDSDFARMYENNPALRYQYTPTFWDKLFRNTPFKTKEKAWIDEQRNNALNYGAELQELDRQQEYNNAVNQAQRERDAGLNPNLDPGSITPGEASENDNATLPEQTRQQTDAETTQLGIEMATSMMGTITNVFMTTASILGKGADIFGKIIETNKSGRASVYDIMKHIMEGHYESEGEQASLYPWENTGGGAFIRTDQMSKDLFLKSDWVKDMFPTAKERKWAWQAYQELQYNYETLGRGRKNLAEYNTAGVELGQAMATSEAWGGSPEATKKAYQPIANFLKRTNELLSEAGVGEATYKRDYYDYMKQNKTGQWQGQAQQEYWQEQYNYWYNYNGSKEAIKINTANELYISLNEAWAKMLKEISAKATDTSIPWYDRIFYFTELKVLGDVQNTNLIDKGFDMMGTFAPKTTVTRFMQ